MRNMRYLKIALEDFEMHSTVAVTLRPAQEAVSTWCRFYMVFLHGVSFTWCLYMVSLHGVDFLLSGVLLGEAIFLCETSSWCNVLVSCDRKGVMLLFVVF